MRYPSRSTNSTGPAGKVMRLLALCLALWMAPAGFTPARGEVFDQYQVKAVFLFNLTNFISWPANPESNPAPAFTIGILGSNPFGGSLATIIQNEKVNKRAIVVRHFSNLDELSQQACDLLFINGERLKIWPQIRSIARKRGILTVSDVKGFCDRGGMINLLAFGRKITIETNINEARRNGFGISAKLLKVAHIINSGKEN